jgi:hypothetical protein
MTDATEGHDIRQLGGVMVFSLLPRNEGEAYAWRRAATGGAATVSDEGVRGWSRGLRRLERGFFLHAFLPNSGTTGVAYEPR